MLVFTSRWTWIATRRLTIITLKLVLFYRCFIHISKEGPSPGHQDWHGPSDKKILSKIETFVKNRNFCQTSKRLSNIENFVKNRNFRQKSKLLSNIENFVKHRKFCQTSKILSTIEIFIKNRNFCEKSKICQKSKISANIVNFIKNFVKNRIF